jgi:perosamine synthetase
MIPRFRPLFGRSELAALLPHRQSGAVREFENTFAAAVGQRHALAFPYGRTGLRLALEAEGLKGAEIICPAYTCVVVPHAIVASGNRPVFIDSGADGNMNLDRAEAAIGAKTKAIIATSIFGHPVDLDRLAVLRRRFPELLVMQDCAHSFACEWRGVPVQQSGDLAIFAFNISKIATSIFGGMVTTDDDGRAERLRRWRNQRLSKPSAARSLARTLYALAAALAFAPAVYGAIDLVRRAGALARFEEYYDPTRIDMPRDHLVALTEVEARVGAVQARGIGDFIAARRRWAEFYRDQLSGCAALRFLPAPPGASFSHVAALAEDRAGLIAASRKAGVELGTVIDYNCGEFACYKPMAGNGPWPVSAFLARHVVNLPLWGRFDRAVADRVVATLMPLLEGCPPAPLPPGDWR